MVMAPEQLMQTMETEHRLNAPPQLATLTRLDQDIQRIIDSSLRVDQKVVLLRYLASRHRGLAKQMKSESKSSQAVLVVPPPPLPLLHRKALVSLEDTSTSKIKPEEPVVDTPSMVPDEVDTPIQSKIPLPVPTPSQAAHHRSATTPSVLDTPTSTPKRGKLRKGRTPVVARLRSNKKWMPY